MAVISCLESVSRTARNEAIVRSDYSINNTYSALSPDAKATNTPMGRGVGTANMAPLPNCNGTINTIGYYNFVTDPASGAGTSVDNEQRETSFARSLYNYESQYSARSVDTAQNVQEGQYVVG